MTRHAMRSVGHRGAAFPSRVAPARTALAELTTRVCVALVIALALSPLIRDVTAGLTTTLEQTGSSCVSLAR